ncbi:hypothetical protein HQ520_06520 [bacterium]|nr:hypothetical protein [bacterium]
MRLFLLLLPVVLLSGCNYLAGGVALVSAAPVVPPRAYVYSHFTAPLILPRADIGQAGEGDIPGVIYLKIPIPYTNPDFSSGQAGVEAACRAAGIETLIGADYEYLSILGYVRRFRIHVYGYPPAKKPRETASSQRLSTSLKTENRKFNTSTSEP